MPHSKNIHSNPSVVKYCDECTQPKQSEEKEEPMCPDWCGYEDICNKCQNKTPIRTDK